MNLHKLQIDFDRNSTIGKSRILIWVNHLLSRYPSVFVDLFAIKGDVLSDVLLVKQKNASSPSLGTSIAEFAGIHSVDTYLCYRVSNVGEFERLCDHYCYTFPKMYRFASSDIHNSLAALDDQFVDKFQYSEIEELGESVINPVIVRDGPHEMWLDIEVVDTELSFLEHSLEYLR